MELVEFQLFKIIFYNHCHKYHFRNLSSWKNVGVFSNLGVFSRYYEEHVIDTTYVLNN